MYYYSAPDIGRVAVVESAAGTGGDTLWNRWYTEWIQQ